MPTRIKQIIAGLLVAIFLCACGSRPGAGPANLLPTFTPTRTDGFYTDTSGPGATETLSPTPNPFVTGTSTATITRTPTIDYSAPGVPSATPTPTLDYVRLAAQNLTPDTPWPTWTGYPPASATANVADILSKVAIRKITPQPPPGLNRTNYAGLLPGLVQSATDLMNATNGNQELYLKTIQSWAPNAMAYSPDDWFLETDFDHDGQPEWLVGMPTASADGRIRCGDPGPVNCYRAFFLFEKIGDGYRPMHILLPAFTDEEAGTSKITLVRDLNNNHMPEIVFRADVCGSNCYTFLRIGEWDGYIWREYRFSAEGSKVTFADRDGNGTIEIALEYSTGGASQYNHPYPFMHGLVDVYGWTNGRFGLISQIRPPTDSVFAVIHDIDQALQFRNPELALKDAKPVRPGAGGPCDQMKAFVGIRTMLAYSLRSDEKSMQAALAQVEQYCDPSTNAYVDIAKFLWAAYQRSHDPVAACEAMDRFRLSEYYADPGQPNAASFLNDPTISIPHCPFR